MPADRASSDPTRKRVETRSAVLLVWLSAQPRWLVAVVALAVLIALLVVHGPLALIPGLLLISAVAWLAYLSWPTLPPAARSSRLGVIALLTLIMVVEVLH